MAAAVQGSSRWRRWMATLRPRVDHSHVHPAPPPLLNGLGGGVNRRLIRRYYLHFNPYHFDPETA